MDLVLANYNAHDLLQVLRYSLVDLSRTCFTGQQLLRNVNKSQFSWKDSAREYANICMSN